MIDFHFESAFKLDNSSLLQEWISEVITSEGYEVGEIQYIFCNDDYLYNLNVEFLQHDTLTDIISFDYKMGQQLNGEIYISIERVLENSLDFKTKFEDELHRVMIHGILHFCGYSDKTNSEELNMRLKEEQALERLSVL